MSDPARVDTGLEDFRLLVDGKIDSREYVRRLEERVRTQRLNAHPPIGGRYYDLERPWRGRSPKQVARLGFWAGVRSILTGGR